MAKYELIVLGSPTNPQGDALTARMAELTSDFDMAIPDDFAIRFARDFAQRDPKASTVALYFGGDPEIDGDLVNTLQAARLPIVPVMTKGSKVDASVPASIREINVAFIDANDDRLDSLASVAAECLGLLRKQRRVFISYRRNESRDVALQLHDQLSSHGFDVFLDTHDIRPGEPFQEMLWHRLVDCDVVIMLETNDYFSSKWTKQELGRTLAKGIQILRLTWPAHKSSRHLSLSDTIQLATTDFTASGQLTASMIVDVVKRTEALRSRSVATRHLDIAGKLRSEVERIGGAFDGIGAHRAIAFSLPNGTKIQAYPVVGVPTAELLNDIHDKAVQSAHDRTPCLVYDQVGIRPAWVAHLAWLDQQINVVRALKVLDAGWELAQWDS